MNKGVILLLVLTLFSISIVQAQLNSDSPINEWWMYGGNSTFSRFAYSNGPANISNTSMINRTLYSGTIDGSAIIVGNSLFIIPDHFSSSKAFELNATNISHHIQNSSGSYTYQGFSPTYYNGSLFIHASGSLAQINASNLSHQIDIEVIGDAFYYSAPVVFNGDVFLGDGNSVSRFRQYNGSNISHIINGYTATNRIYASAPMLSNYSYVSETSLLRQVNTSNVSQTLNTRTCAANGIEYVYPATPEYVYKTCTVNSVDMLRQLNATNISQEIANFTNATTGYALGNGYLYFGLRQIFYQLNATNISQVIANYTIPNANMSSLIHPIGNRDYIYMSAGNIMYQFDADNVSSLIGNYTAPTTISSSPTLANGFLYFSAGSILYQLGVQSSYNTSDVTTPSVTLNSPIIDYVNSSSNPVNVNFNCSATDNLNLTSIKLYLTNNTNASFALNQTTNTSGLAGSVNWTLNLANGNYTWNCLGTDSSNNVAFASANRSILINYTAPIVEDEEVVEEENETLDSSVGEFYTLYIANDIYVGYTKKLSRYSKLQFEVLNNQGNEETHTLTIDSLSNGRVGFTVRSEPQRYNLKSGEVIELKLNNEQVNLRIQVLEVTSKYAEMKINGLEIKKVSEENTETEIVGLPEAKDLNLTWRYVSIFIIGLILGGLIIWEIIQRRRPKHMYKGIFDYGH